MESTTNEYWYLDYEKGLAKRYMEGPKHESIRKWSGTIVEFLKQRGTVIIEEGNDFIKFKPEIY